jgi:hypothetical protein
MQQDERNPAGNTIHRFRRSKHAVGHRVGDGFVRREDDSPSPCIVAAMCEASRKFVLVAGPGIAGVRRNSGMDDGDTSTVNEEKERCSLP